MNKDVSEVLRAAAPGLCTMATVVGIEGSSYRRPGARMLIDDRGRRAGSISGGCLERTLVKRGRWLASEGPKLLRLATSAEPDETELSYLGCGGTILVLLENLEVADEPPGDRPASAHTDHIGLLRWVCDQRAPAVLATVIGATDELPLAARVAITDADRRIGTGADALLSLCQRDAEDALRAGSSAWREYAVGGATCEVFLEYLPPVRELLLCGRHHDVKPVVDMAQMLGWRVTVAADETSAAELGPPDALIAPTPARVGEWANARPDAAVVVMSHSLALDRQLLAALLAAPTLSYLGVLGPYHRTRDMLDQLQRDGARVSDDALARLRAPIGLDLGGDGPAAVALSIIAEIQTVWSGRSARPLHLRTDRGIHEGNEREPAPRELSVVSR